MSPEPRPEPRTDLVFVDADGHLLEPPTALVDYAPDEYRDTVWQVHTEADGVEWLTLEDMRMEAAVMALAGAGGFDDAQRTAAHSGAMTYGGLPDYCWTAKGRLDALDGDGISQSVLYPTMLLTFQHLRSLDFAEMQCRVYNDWLSDLCADGEGRLHGVAVLPHLDPERAAAEIRRVAGLPHIVGVQVRPNPALGFRHLNREEYDPIWQAASDVGLPIGFHPLASNDLPGAVQGLRLGNLGTSEIPVQDQADYGSDNIFFAQALGNPTDMMAAIMFMTAGGVLDRFPTLIYADVTGYGYDTPYRDRPSYDMGGFWARSGAAQSHAVGSEPPPALRGGSGDHMTANALVGGISAALFDRTRTGKGRHVSASLVRTGAYLVGQDYSMQLRVGTAFSLGVPRTNASNPMLNSYLTKDGKWLWLLGLQPDRHFPKVAVAVDRPDLLADERFATPNERRLNGPALIAELDAAIAAKTLAEWAPIFAELDVWYEPVLSVADGVDDDILRAAGTFIEAPGRDGAVPAVATPVDFDRTPSIPSAPTPDLGEHTEEILLALGHDWDRIIEWKTDGIVL